MTTPDYLDTAGVAEMLGVRPETVYRYRVNPNLSPPFPEPDLVISYSPAWLRERIEDWQKLRPGKGAGGGRPRKEKSDANRNR